ncbi:MAG: type III secretion system chaperone [Succinivibrio sp.]|nr:type III secretion system chaperone [Succinivibrio sp.]
MDAQTLLLELAFNLGIELSFSKDKTCAIKFGNETVVFEEYDQQLYLICELGSASDQEEACVLFMSANYLGKHTGNAVLSYDELHDTFVLHKILCLNLNYEQFVQILSEFVGVARHYKLQLSNSQSSKESTDAQLSLFNFRV